MKTSPLVIATVMICSIGTIFGRSALQEFSDPTTSNARLDKLISILSSESILDIGPSIVKLSLGSDVYAQITYVPHTDKPWMEADIPANAKIQIAAQEVWRRLLTNIPPHERNSVFLGFAGAKIPPNQRIFYIGLIKIDHPLSDKEIKELISFTSSAQEDKQVSYLASVILIQVDVNRYFPLFVDSCKRFPLIARGTVLINGMSRCKSGKDLNSVNQTIFLDYAFSTVAQLNGGNVQSKKAAYKLAYCLARYLGIDDASERLSSGRPAGTSRDSVNDTENETIQSILAWRKLNYKP